MASSLKHLENVATLRATNAAGMARLQLAEDHARLTKANLEAANSRIMDVDVAEESTRFAKYNILTQASAAMLSQANQSSSTALCFSKIGYYYESKSRRRKYDLKLQRPSTRERTVFAQQKL